MSELIQYSFYAILLTALEYGYFGIARRYNIIDKPNQRSSHIAPTIRGGGIIFLFALIVWFVTNDFKYPWLMLGTSIIGMVSFIDDVGEQPARIRLLIQLIAFGFMGWQTGLVAQPLWMSVIMLIIGVGTINAFNFMDGINGITGVYSLINLVTFYVINKNMTAFTDERLVLMMILGVVVFLFFNFRIKARCFAGDVGSVTIAFVQLFFLLQLVYTTGHYGWIFLFLIYGVDTVVTIVYRLLKRENIFKAHRMHLFQYFSNELGMPQLWVSVLYGLLQLFINILLFLYLPDSPLSFSLILMLIVGVVYVVVRELVLKKIGMKGILAR